MKLEEFRVYQDAMEMGEDVWEIMKGWDRFATDSVAANISEGLGRYHYKETKNFSYYSRGSLFETKTWHTKAKNRKLVDEDTFSNFMKTIDDIGVHLNNYIRSIGKPSLTKVPKNRLMTG